MNSHFDGYKHGYNYIDTQQVANAKVMKVSMQCTFKINLLATIISFLNKFQS